MSRCSAGVEPDRKIKMSCFPQTEGGTIAEEEHLAETRISDANWFPEFIACQVCFEANDVWRLRKFRLIHNIVEMEGDWLFRAFDGFLCIRILRVCILIRDVANPAARFGSTRFDLFRICDLKFDENLKKRVDATWRRKSALIWWV